MILENIMKLSYTEFVVYLKTKYGIPKESYFKNYSTGRLNYNTNNSRTNEGLMIHHVYENQYVYLSNSDICKDLINEHPETQNPENLVYCNYLEHLILHIKITEELNMHNTACGWGGIFSIIQHINSLYNYYYINADTEFHNIKQQYKINCINAIINQLNDYLYLIDYIMNNIMERIILCSEGTLSTRDLWRVYEDDKVFCIIQNRVKAHSRYSEYNKLSYNLRTASPYNSLNDVYIKKFNIKKICYE